MIKYCAEHQRWAKITPYAAILSFVLFIIFFRETPYFILWMNIPLYLLHQMEEHYLPGGFKDYMNTRVFQSKEKEYLTDTKIFWINILCVWLAFLLFALLSRVALGFGIVLIVFSLINCITHITTALRFREYNPGLCVVIPQTIFSIYAIMQSMQMTIEHRFLWWLGSVFLSVIVHRILFQYVMGNERGSRID